jgi:hypothetical protein
MGSGQFSNYGNSLQFALYLEGVRVPFIKATISATPNKPSVCKIDLPPFASAAAIRPRTLVHLFYYDEPFCNNRIGVSTPDKPTWRLLFEGEMSHLDIVQSERAKYVSLTCQDFINYWYHVYQYFINNQKDLFGSQVEIATFANASFEPQIATIYNNDFPGTLNEDIVLNTIFGKSGVTRENPIIGLLDLLVTIGGFAGSFTNPGINRFFGDAESRLKMAGRVFTLQDDTLTNYFNVKSNTAALNIMRGMVQKLSGLGTVSDVVDRFLAHTFYDYVPLLAPPFGVNPSKDSGSGGPPKNVNGAATVLNTILKPKTFFLPAPRCNIFFPDRLSSFKYSRSYLDEPSRLRLKISSGLPSDNVSFVTNAVQDLVIYAPPYLDVGNANPLKVEETKTTSIQQTIYDQVKANALVIPDIKALIKTILRDYGFYPDASNLVFDTSRDISEPECGIVPLLQELDINQSLLIAQLATRDKTKSIQENLLSTPEASDRLKYFLTAANYQLDVQKFACRTVEDISGPFNPNLLVGFPGVILDSMALILGNVMSVTHVLDSAGGSVTTASMSHARTIALSTTMSSLDDTSLARLSFFDATVGSEYKNPKTGATTRPTDLNASDLPPFLNDKYNPSTIESQVYVPVFGTKSVLDLAVETPDIAGVPSYDNVGSSTTDQFTASFNMYKQYLLAKDKIGFANFATRRGITTIDELRAHYTVFGTFTPIFQNAFYLMVKDEFLFDFAGRGPVFKDTGSGGTATKQIQVLNFTKDIRRSLGTDSTSLADGEDQKSGGVVGT